MIKDFGNSKLERFKAGQPLLDQVTAERLNDVLSMIEACRLQNGVGYMLNRSASGTTFTVLGDEFNRPPKLWKVSLDDLDLDPATLISKVINAVMDEIIGIVSNPGQFIGIFYDFLSQIISAITTGNAGSASGVKSMIEGVMQPIYGIIDTVDNKVEQFFGKVDPVRSTLENYFTARGKRPRSGDMVYTDELGICYTLYKEVSDDDGTYPTPNLIFRVPFTVGRSAQGDGGTKFYALTVFPMPDVAECVKTILKAVVKFISALLGSTFEGIVQAIMNAVSEAIYALYELLWEIIEMLMELVEQLFAMLDALWAAINSLWGALSNLAASLTETFTNMLNALNQDLSGKISELSNQFSEIFTELGLLGLELDAMNADLDELAEILRELIEKTTFVNVIDNQGKAITVKVLEKTGPDIDMRQQLNWVHGTTGTSYQAKALYWDLTTPAGIRPTQVSVCEGSQSRTKTFLEKP